MEILLSVASAGTPSAAAIALKNLIESFGHTVTYQTDNAAPPAGFEDNFDALVIGYDANQTPVSALVNTVLPVLVLRGDKVDDFGGATSGGSVTTSDTDRWITSPAHPIITTLGWSTGVDRTLFSSGQAQRSFPGIPGAAQVVLEEAGSGDEQCWTLETGTTDANSLELTGRRAYFGAVGGNSGNFTADMDALLDELIDWITTTPDLPLAPTITEEAVDGSSVTISLSAYDHEADPDPAWAATQIQLQKPGWGWGDVTDPLIDMTITVRATRDANIILGDPELEPLTIYEVRARDKDAAGFWGPWSVSLGTVTGEDLGESTFVPSEWAPLWNRNLGYYGTVGAWAVGEDGGEWFVDGRLIQRGRFLFDPAAMVKVSDGGGFGHDVSCWLLNAGFETDWWPWRYRENEGVRAGVVANCSGTCALYPSDIAYTTYGFVTSREADDMSGVRAYIRWPVTIYAYGGCDKVGTGYSDGELVVEVWYQGEIQQTWTSTIPGNELDVLVRGCLKYPWYTIRLQVTRDYGTDAEGKAHDIKAGWQHGRVAKNDVAWDIEETWTGGDDESAPGEADGGLPCGFAGASGERYSGLGGASAWRGWSVYTGFDIETTQVGSCVLAAEPPEDDTPPEVSSPTPVTPSACPPEEVDTSHELYLGASSNKVLQYGASETDDGTIIIATVRPNSVAPWGMGAAALLRDIYLAFQHIGDVAISVTPVVNGEELTAQIDSIYEIGSGALEPKKKELAVTRPYVGTGTANVLRRGVRGQHLSVIIRAQDICGSGLSLDGLVYEVERVRAKLDAPYSAFTEELLGDPIFLAPYRLYFGAAGKKVLEASVEQQNQDDATDYDSQALSNWVAPAGHHGEAAFFNLYVTLSRWNTSELTLQVVHELVKDDELLTLATEEVTLAATTTPVRGEVIEVPISKPYTRSSAERLRTAPRGTWYRARLTLTTAPDHFFTMEGTELEFEIVRESTEAHVNA